MNPTPQQMMMVPCTGVMVRLTMKPEMKPERLMPHMHAEIVDTVKLYLEGKIAQWWAQCDAPGVVFLFRADAVETVRGWMAELPLVKEDLVDLEFFRVGPLAPLRLLSGA